MSETHGQFWMSLDFLYDTFSEEIFQEAFDALSIEGVDYDALEGTEPVKLTMDDEGVTLHFVIHYKEDLS